MDYLDRLIRRALAVPRVQSGMFDPFERVAPWAAEPAAATAPAAANPVDLRSTPVAAMVDRVQPVLPPAMSPAAAPVLPSLPSIARVHDTTEASPAAPSPAAELVQPAAPDIDLPPVTPVSRLARADAFMQGLGMPQAAREGEVPLAVPPPPAIDPPPRASDAPAVPTARQAPDEPVLLRPQPPRAPTAPAAAALPRRPAPAENAGRSPPQPATRPPRPPELQRIMQTTLVVAPPSRRLDELAHSSAISRFGIGQG